MNFREAQELTESGEIPLLRGGCTRCFGWGYTQAESPLFRDGKTIEQGSGCTRCGGNGVDPEWTGR